MVNKELRDLLKLYPDEAEVLINDSRDGLSPSLTFFHTVTKIHGGSNRGSVENLALSLGPDSSEDLSGVSSICIF
jgi:hypothetical protein